MQGKQQLVRVIGRFEKLRVRELGLYCISLNEPGGEGTPYNGLYREAPPKRGTLFRLEVYKRVGISRAEV